MARLTLFLKDEVLQTLSLELGKDYLIGRSETCDIIMPPERGISRQHLKLLSNTGQWRVEVVSRYGELYLKQQKVSDITLDKDMEFEVPPYRFVYVQNEAMMVSGHSLDADKTSSDLGEEFNDDRTVVGVLPAVAQLKLYDDRGDNIQVFRLEGEFWSGGREVNCQIFIDNPKVSRRQFEINLQNRNYYIRDSGSANGTLLNSQPLSVEEWAILQSGDIIQILDWTLQFELRDVSFEKRLEEASPFMNAPVDYSQEQGAADVPELSNPSQAWFSGASSQYGEGVAPSEEVLDYTLPPPVPAWKKVKPLHWVVIGIAIVAVVGLLLDDDGASKKVKPSMAQKDSTGFSKLDNVKKQYIVEGFNLSKKLFTEGRYEMARDELTKVHQLVTYYEDSRTLMNDIEMAIQLKAQKAKLEAEERDRLEIEDKIQRQLKVCRAKLTPQVGVRDIDDCLSPIVQFNPEHPGIVALKSQVDQIISDRNIREAQRADYLARVNKHKALYEKAESLKRAAKPLLAIQAYGTVIRSTLPDPSGLKGQAKRQIASIQENLARKQAVYESEAEQSHKRGDLKSAIVSLKKAVQINPDNEVIKGRLVSMLQELKKQMQTFYQEAILEESVGEVETAKTKWKKILDLSLPEEDYYKKALLKLKKYGAM